MAGHIESADTLLLLADLVLIVHALFVGFVVFGLAIVLIGGVMDWRWVRNIWFRGAHLLATLFVVLQQWAGMICPLTTWEMDLRTSAGGRTYEDSFIVYWLHELIFYQAPPWVFTLAYTMFAVAVIVSIVLVRPRL
jgi:hypothetical protein